MNNEKEKDRTLSVLKSFLSQNNLVYEYKNNTEFFREQDSGKIRFFLHEDNQFDQYIFIIISKYTILDKTEEKAIELCQGFGLSYKVIFENKWNKYIFIRLVHI